MKRIVAVFVVSVVLAGLAGCSSTGGMESLASLASEPAVSSLTQSLGVSANQAIGGLGSMMSLAKGKLSPDQFKQVAAAIPSADKYMSALDGLGIKGADIKDAAGLKSAFSKLGMNAEQAAGFVPAVADMAGKAGGDTVKGMLAGLGM